VGFLDTHIVPAKMWPCLLLAFIYCIGNLPFAVGVATPTHAFDFRASSGSDDVGDSVGTLTASMREGALCVAGEGVVLDGDDDYVVITAWTWGGAPVSFELMIKVSGLGPYARLFDFGNSDLRDKVDLSLAQSTSDFIFEGEVHTGANYVRSLFSRSCNCVCVSPVYSGYTSNTPLVSNGGFFTVGGWTHVVVTVDDGGGGGSGKWSIYRDGSLFSSVANSPVPYNTERTSNLLGHSNYFSSDANLEGTIAFLNMWEGSALSAADVLDLYAAVAPSAAPTLRPSDQPTPRPVPAPTGGPSLPPTPRPSDLPSLPPTTSPTVACAAGQFVSGAGAGRSCENCPLGQYSPVSAPPWPSSCAYCPSGTYSAFSGAASCELCPGGKLSSPDRTFCGDCNSGEYSFNATECR